MVELVRIRLNENITWKQGSIQKFPSVLPETDYLPFRKKHVDFLLSQTAFNDIFLAASRAKYEPGIIFVFNHAPIPTLNSRIHPGMNIGDVVF
jgi:hypothetical protein